MSGVRMGGMRVRGHFKGAVLRGCLGGAPPPAKPREPTLAKCRALPTAVGQPPTDVG